MSNMSLILEGLNDDRAINEGKLSKEELENICDELNGYLLKRVPKHIANSLFIANGKIKAEIDGDWKHDHLLFKNTVKDFFSMKKIKVDLDEVIETSSGDDSYEAVHTITIIK